MKKLIITMSTLVIVAILAVVFLKTCPELENWLHAMTGWD